MSKVSFESCKEYTSTIMPTISNALSESNIEYKLDNNEIVVEGKKKEEIQKVLNDINVPNKVLLILIDVVELINNGGVKTFIRQKSK